VKTLKTTQNKVIPIKLTKAHECARQIKII